MDETDVKSVTNDIVSVINESHDSTQEEGNKDNAVNVSAKKVVMDEEDNKNQNNETLPIENGDPVANGNVDEHRDVSLDKDEMKEKDEVETMEKDVAESVEGQSNDLPDSNIQPSESIVQQDMNETQDNDITEKQDLPERTEKEKEDETEIIPQETIDTPPIDDNNASGGLPQEDKVEVVTEEIIIAEPEPDECTNEPNVGEEGVIIQTSMVSHMVSSPHADSEEQVPVDNVETVSNEQQVNSSVISEAIVEETITSSEALEKNTQENLETTEPLVEHTETVLAAEDAGQDGSCTSMVAHMVATEPSEGEKIENSDNGLQDEAPKQEAEMIQSEIIEVKQANDENVDENEPQITQKESEKVIEQPKDTSNDVVEKVEDIEKNAPEIDAGDNGVTQADSINTKEESADVAQAETQAEEVVNTASMVTHMVHSSVGEEEVCPTSTEDKHDEVIDSNNTVEVKEDNELQNSTVEETLAESLPADAPEAPAEDKPLEISDNQTEAPENTTSMVSHMTHSLPEKEEVCADENKESENIDPVDAEKTDLVPEEVLPVEEKEAGVNIEGVEVKIEETETQTPAVEEENIIENITGTQEDSIPVEQDIVSEVEDKVEISPVLPVLEVAESKYEEVHLTGTSEKTETDVEATKCENTVSEEAQASKISDEGIGEQDTQSEPVQAKEECSDSPPGTLENEQKQKEEEFEIVDASMCCEEISEQISSPTTNVTSTDESVPLPAESNQERIIAIEVDNKASEEIIESSENTAATSLPSETEIIIPVQQESQEEKTNEDKEESSKANQESQEQIIEPTSSSKDTECADPDEGTKIEHSKDETMQCSVEKEIIESEEGAKIERTKTCETQIIRETKKQTTVSETVEQLTPEELFEKFPELRGSILNETSESNKSEVVESGTGTFEDPKNTTASHEESKVTSSTCPEDKDATMITITSSSLTKQTMQASSSTASNGTTEESSKGPSPPARKHKESESKDKKSSDVETAPKDENNAGATVVNVPINVEILNDKPESSAKETVSTPPKPVSETKPPEAARNPPARPVNQQQGICCIIL